MSVVPPTIKAGIVSRTVGDRRAPVVTDDHRALLAERVQQPNWILANLLPPIPSSRHDRLRVVAPQVWHYGAVAGGVEGGSRPIPAAGRVVEAVQQHHQRALTGVPVNKRLAVRGCATEYSRVLG